MKIIIEELIDKGQREAFDIRKEYAKEIFTNQEQYREDFKRMPGWPLVDCKAEGLPCYCGRRTSMRLITIEG